jgi:hypothetical protein
LDTVWIEPRRFFRCWLCGQFYDIIDGQFVKINVDEELAKHIAILIEQQEKSNEGQAPT